MDSLQDVWNVLLTAFIIFGGVLGYIPQYMTMRKNRTSEGFSKWVCLVLLASNIVRLLFWLGRKFDTALVYQVRIIGSVRSLSLIACRVLL